MSKHNTALRDRQALKRRCQAVVDLDRIEQLEVNLLLGILRKQSADLVRLVSLPKG
jgi:hypothetical protein